MDVDFNMASLVRSSITLSLKVSPYTNETGQDDNDNGVIIDNDLFSSDERAGKGTTSEDSRTRETIRSNGNVHNVKVSDRTDSSKRDKAQAEGDESR